MLTPSSGSITSFSPSSTWSKRAGSSATAMALAYVRLREKAIVALSFQAVSQFGAALFSHSAVNEDVHEVGLDVAKDARVVGDQQQAQAGGILGPVHSVRDNLERVDVEAGVGLVEHG